MCQQTQLLPGRGAWLGLLTPVKDKGFPWEVWRGSGQLPRHCDVVQSLLGSPESLPWSRAACPHQLMCFMLFWLLRNLAC